MTVSDRAEAVPSSRVAVVTGGGTGIGRGIVRALVADGWEVVIVGRRRDVLDALASESDRITALDADLTDPAAVEQLARLIGAQFPIIDLLVANAGSADRRPQNSLADVAAHWTAAFDRVVLTTVLVEHALRPLLRRPGGRVVLITSAAARTLGGQPSYGAAKAAVNRWLLSLADELGGEGITVNAVAPGFVPDTELYAAPVDDARRARTTTAIAVRRAGTPADIADAVLWLAQPGSGFVSGTVIEVDGGRRMTV